MDQTTSPAIKAILTEMGTITTMERGTLSEEYRSVAASAGGAALRLGPYYKLQAWEKGRNASRRVPAAEVPAVREDLANYERFTELSEAFVEETIARTRARRRGGAALEEGGAAKKNSTKKPGASDTRKRKASLPKSKRA